MHPKTAPPKEATPTPLIWKPRDLENRVVDTIDHGEAVRYVELSHIQSSNKKAILIKAPMGTGKSCCVAKYINTLPLNSRVLVIGPRQTFDMAITAELNRTVIGDKFICYLGKSIADVRGTGRVVIQFESLWKLDARGVTFENVIVDEFESVLTQAVAIETNGDKIRKNQKVFEAMLKECKRLFLMDAFLSDRTFRLVDVMNIEYTFHHYHRKPVERVAIRYDRPFNPIVYAKRKDQIQKELTDMIRQLICDLCQGKRIYFFSSSVGKVEQIVSTISKAEHIPRDLVILQYHGQKKNDLTQIREDWSKANLVIATCSITVGCNYDYSEQDHPEFMFDAVYMYASACSQNLIRDMFQSQMRVRHLKENQMHFFLNPSPLGCDPYRSRNQVGEYIRDKEDLSIKLWGERALDYDQTSLMWMELYLDAQVERNHSARLFEPMFLSYLEQNNYSMHVIAQAEVADDGEDLEPLGDKFIQYESVPEVTLSQVRALKERRASNDPSVSKLTDLESASIDRHYFDRSIHEDLQLERKICLWDLYYKLGKERILNCRFEKGLAVGLITLSDLFCEARADMWNKSLEIRASVITGLCKELGLRNTVELQKITAKKFEVIEKSERFQVLKREASTAFQPDPRRMTKPETWINHCIEKWTGGSFSRDKVQQQRVNGVKENVSGYTLTPVDNGLYKDLKPRVSRRSDYGVQQIILEEAELAEEARE
jgi:hypothetical protein